MHWPKLRITVAAAAWIAITAAVPADPVALYGSCPADQSAPVCNLYQEISSCTEVYFPGSAGFYQGLLRWSSYKAPQANMVVLPCSEADVVATVKYANMKKMHFLATTSGHGTIYSLGNMHSGILIWLDKLSGVKIAKDGKTVVVSGGTKSKNVTETLWSVGKQTVTGTAECVSYMGPGLGGGHGFLQGKYGLISDQYVSLNVVLADGTLKTIDAKDDLFWAMKGAGQNFGIVTSVTSKIFDVDHKNWAVATLSFTGDKVKAVYEAANNRFIDGNQTEGIVTWSNWANDKTIDTKNPVISFAIMQEGVKSVDQVWLKPFFDIGPASIQNQSGTYPDLSGFIGSGADSIVCQKTGRSGMRFSVYLKRYNTTALQEAYDVFAKNAGGDSAFNNSRCMLEGYPTQGVRASSLNASAFAFRDSNLLTLASIEYMPDGSDDLDKKAIEMGKKFRDVMQKGSGSNTRRVYVNYGFGDETTRDWYGNEDWRQERLRYLKKKYDPKGKYDFYGPIP